MSIKPPLPRQPLSSSQWFQPVSAELDRLGAPVAEDLTPGAEQAAGEGAIQSGRFVAEQTNTITVTRDDNDETVTVAKPPDLRGNIKTRINSDGDTEEIFRSYFPNDVILFASVLDSGVGDVTLADLNWNARRWTIEVS